MKVIHILNELKYSGAEIMYVDAAPVFKYLGCELTVVATSKNIGEFATAFKKSGYKILHREYNNNLFSRWRYYFDFILLLKREKIDVVHTHRSNLKWGMALCAKIAGCKSVYTFHNVFASSWYSYPWHLWLRWSAKHILGCVFQTISDSVYNNEKSYYHNNTSKIYNWYGNKRFFPAVANEKNNIKAKLGIPLDSLVIVSVGGCSPIKRHTDIIKALPQIIKRYPKTVYLHLGEGCSLEKEKKLASDLMVDSHIRFCGNQTIVRDYLIASDIYVMPSRHEGIPLTTIEAIGCCIPAILYNVPGLKDFNKTKECSLLIAEDYNILASTICDLYENQDLQTKITENGKVFVDENFDMETNATKIFELYN